MSLQTPSKMKLRPSLNDSDEEHWQWLIKTRNDDDCDTGSMKPRSNRAFHWSFVIPSHDEDVVAKLKNLTNADVVCAAMYGNLQRRHGE